MLGLLGVLLGLGVWFLLHLLLPRNYAGSGEHLALKLKSAPFEVLYYCQPKKPVGIVILGTGDGGWSYWEENTATHLSAKGYAVGGWDCRKFADSRTYGHDELCAGYSAAVAAVRKRCRAPASLPIWYAGWSTGAEQAVAAATAEDRPKHLIGLLLAAPGRRGRYGIIASDLIGIEPSGPDTFALADLVPKLKGLRVVQFAAGLDPMDDEECFAAYPGPQRCIQLPGKMHDMGGAGPDFQQALDEAMLWTLSRVP